MSGEEAVRKAIAKWELGDLVCSIRAVPKAKGAEAEHFVLCFGRPTKAEPIPPVTIPVHASAIPTVDGMELQFRINRNLTVFSGADMETLAATLIPRELDAREKEIKDLGIRHAIPLVEEYEKTRLGHPRVF